jgi:RND family efflux transporter MFP subunit
VFKLRKGEAVEVTTSVYPGSTFKGIVYTIGSKADAAHNYPVEVLVSNSAREPFKAGMFAQVSFVSQGKKQAIVIPREALEGSTKDAKVYVVRGGKAVLTSIQVVGESEGQLIVASGLTEGDAIVTQGQINLYDQAEVVVQGENKQ